MSHKILITGAGGYIGSVATDLFLQNGYEVVAVDSLIRGYRSPLKYLQDKYGQDKLHYYESDIRTDIDSILQKEPGITTVIHYAAFCNVGESEKDPGLYYGNSVETCVALLDALAKYNIKNIVFSSTCAVYGEPQTETLDETHSLNPIHPYGDSKYMCEKIIQAYAKVFDMKYVFLRYFNVCGATDDGSIGDSKNPSYHLMQNAVRGVLGIAPFFLNYTQVDTPDGSPIRDYVNVVDLNEAHLKAVQYIETGGASDVFNLGTGNGNSVLEIIKTVENITGKTIEKQQGERRSSDVSKAVASKR
jgi:UDP-glucose 4-epimerase